MDWARTLAQAHREAHTDAKMDGKRDGVSYYRVACRALSFGAVDRATSRNGKIKAKIYVHNMILVK